MSKRIMWNSNRKHGSSISYQWPMKIMQKKAGSNRRNIEEEKKEANVSSMISKYVKIWRRKYNEENLNINEENEETHAMTIESWLSTWK